MIHFHQLTHLSAIPEKYGDIMSISSVTDDKTAVHMLQCDSPARSRSPDPNIHVESEETNDISLIKVKIRVRPI